MKHTWQWRVLIALSFFVLISQIYLEIGLILQLYFVPQPDSSGDLKYQESLGLFAPAIYLLEGGVKILSGLSPFLRLIKELILALNSVLLMVTLLSTRYMFKHKLWAAIYGVIMFVVAVVFWLDL